MIAIAAGGAAVLNTVEDANEPLPGAVRWLLVGSLAAALVSVVLLTETLEAKVTYPEIYRAADLVMVAGAVLSRGVGLTDWGAKAGMGAMVVLLFAPVIAGLMVWL